MKILHHLSPRIYLWIKAQRNFKKRAKIRANHKRAGTKGGMGPKHVLLILKGLSHPKISEANINNSFLKIASSFWFSMSFYVTAYIWLYGLRLWEPNKLGARLRK